MVLEVLTAAALTYTAPAFDAWADSVCAGPSPVPITVELVARLWGWSETGETLERFHTVQPGQVDTFLVDPGDVMWTYYLQTRKGDGPWSCRSNLVGVNGRLEVPEVKARDWRCWPNPMVGTATCVLWIAQAGPVVVEVHDIAGRLASRLELDYAAVGEHYIRVDLRPHPAGVYQVTVRAHGYRDSWRLVKLE